MVQIVGLSCLTTGETGTMALPGLRTNANLTRSQTRPLTPAGYQAAGKPAGATGGWVWLLIFVVVVFAIVRCSSSPTGSGSSSSAATADNAQQAIMAAVSAQTPPPVQKLSSAAVAKGLSHLQLASGEGLAGEMIYSQNCYDALGRKFTWSKLDACGAFDAETTLGLGDTEAAGAVKETSWFQSEAAAGRFLKAATSAGEPAEEADQRWSAIQAKALRHRPEPAASPAAAPEPVASPDGNNESGPATDDGERNSINV